MCHPGYPVLPPSPSPSVDSNGNMLTWDKVHLVMVRPLAPECKAVSVLLREHSELAAGRAPQPRCWPHTAPGLRPCDGCTPTHAPASLPSGGLSGEGGLVP